MTRPLQILLLLAGLAACTGDHARPTALPTAAPAHGVARDLTPDSPWRPEFERVAQGLWYSSEADYPFEFFFAPATLPDGLDPAAFLAALGLSSDAQIEERDWDAFFARHIEHVDPYDAASLALVPSYQQLKFTLEEALNYRHVYCLGHVVLRCYVAGTDESGNVLGVATTLLET